MSKIKKWLKMHCPDLPVLRKIMKIVKMYELRRCFLSEDEVIRAEQTPSEKAVLVMKCEKRWSAKTRKVADLLDRYLEQSGTVLEDYDTVKIDVIFHYFGYGFTPDEYFFYNISGKSIKEKRAYISDRERTIFTYSLDDIKTLEVFYNKYKTYQRLKPFFQREAIYLQGEKDFAAFCEYVEKFPVFVRKSVYMGRGKGVELFDSIADGRSKEEVFSYFLSMGPQILEERIIQKQEMSVLNASSINTIRCPSLRTAKGIELAPCRFRTGRAGSFVDNAGSGGILAAIEPKNGKVISDGFDEYCNRFEKHPDSGITFRGFQIPEWENLRKTVIEMASLFPDMGYISWDMALTEKGWVIVEGNGSGQFIGAQITAERGIKKEIAQMMKNTNYTFR